MGSAVGGTLLGIGGRLIGGFLGGPVGAAIGGIAGGLIGSFLGNRSQKPLISDYQLANSSFGRPIPLIYGQWRLPATVIWESNIDTVSQGLFGKGLGGGGSTGPKYFQSAAFAFCQGPATLLKVWLDGKLFYDVTSAFPQEIVPSGGQFTARFYNGTEDQLPDPLIQAWVNIFVNPPLACPAYRGTAYFVAEKIELNKFGGRMPNFTAAYTTDWQEKVVYQQMTPLATDPNFQPIDPSTHQVSLQTSIDWSSGLLYVMNQYDGQVSEFDIRTGQELLTKSWDQMWAPTTPPIGYDLPAHYFAGAITKVAGGNLYIASATGFDPVYLWTLNPNTLQITHSITLPRNPTLTGIGPWYLVPFQITSALVGGTDDMLVRVDTQYQQVEIINPQTGATSPWLPVHWAGLDGQTNAIIGKQDTLNGIVEVWITSTNSLAGDCSMYIYKVTVTGTDPGSVTLPAPSAVLFGEDFGNFPSSSNAFVSPTAYYDASDDTLVLSCSSTVNATIKWSPTLGVIWRVTPAVVSGNAVPESQNYTDISFGRLAGGSSFTFNVADANSGSLTTIDAAAAGASDPSPPPAVFTLLGYNSGLNGLAFSSFVSSSYQIWVAYLQRSTPTEVSVAAILTDLCERAGIAQSAIDVSLVWQTTRGYAVEDEKAFGSAIADLCQIYQIDMVESDYKLKFVPRGQASVATIVQDDLASVDQDPGHYWQTKRAIEQEMPLQITTRYHDVEIDYQTGASYAKRIALPVPTMYSKRVKTIDLPLVSTNAEAHQIAETWLYSMWAERTTYESKLAQKYLWLDPTDNITVSLDNGDTLTVRIEKSEIDVDLTLKIDGASEDIETYNPSLTASALISQGVQTITQSPPLDLLQVNIPLLSDGEDLGGVSSRIYYAAGPIGAVTNPASAVLYESTDGGTSWPVFDTIAGFASWGYAHTAAPLGDTSSVFATDYTNTLTVVPAAGSTIPPSITYTELMNGSNMVIVGQEIIQFQTAATNADGTVTLSVLVRGARGTDWATGTHTVGELVIFLEGNDVHGASLPLAQLNVSEMWKLVPSGRFLDSTVADSFTYLGYDLKPYAPVNCQREISGSPADLILSWTRRSRLGGGDGLILDGSDTTALGETSESYEVYLLGAHALASFDPTDASTYQRKFATPITSATVTYTASMMSADSFDPSADTLNMVTYQLSSVVGRGFRGYQAVAAF